MLGPTESSAPQFELVKLPPHLVQRIRSILIIDLGLPALLRDELSRAIEIDSTLRLGSTDHAGQRDGDVDVDTDTVDESGDSGSDAAGLTNPDPDPGPDVRTIRMETLESLSRWAGSGQGGKRLERKRLSE